MRDYIHGKPRSRECWEEDLAQRYDRLFPNLRQHIGDFNRASRFAPLRPRNYDASCPQHKRALYSNLRNTEIDVVLESPGHLFIGEAKHESILKGNGRNVLVHQLIRQYVMASILVELFTESHQDRTAIRVVPFIVADKENLQRVRGRTQVSFMIHEGWLDSENILSWQDIEMV